MDNTTNQDDFKPQVYVTKDAVVRTMPLSDNNGMTGYYSEVVITKEIFIECYERWIKNGR